MRRDFSKSLNLPKVYRRKQDPTEEQAAFAERSSDDIIDAGVTRNRDCSDTIAGSEWEPDSEDRLSIGNEILGSGDEGDDSIGDDLRAKVTQLIQEGSYNRKCMRRKTLELEQFLCSLSQMSGGERKKSILTAFAVLKKTATVLRHQDHGLGSNSTTNWLSLSRYAVRRDCLGVSTATVTRHPIHINFGAFSNNARSNRLNQNARTADLSKASLYKRKLYSITFKVYVGQLYHEMHNYVEEIALRMLEPRPSVFRQYLTKGCPNIRIRSPRSNVCDVCSIYWTRIKGSATAAETEAFEYKANLAHADSSHAVIVIDNDQNLTLPSVCNTPSQ
ncbi:LOW QUALITY PROTEIN: Hypothetical protein PHPALM_14295 [Phytophthora palmivora]|uniref:Uncharacterized protein n=1 Tax=Phytophthora palmivora TaxID=4796 RepID=A0A2P4XV36_9STRA|nr:LOW QUALITY PROTEIN: Hypothetical protein PHPALM_14295 [Phytophthora palmivora]